MRKFADEVLSVLFGFIFIGLSLVVTVETVLRKLFSVSIQGADELGGYALAVGATLAFAIAATGRNHIRVDVIHSHLPRGLQAALNWTSVVMLASFSSLLAFLAFRVIVDTMSFHSVAQTPWATPLIYPQSVWFAGLAIFAMVTCALALRATQLLISGRVEELNDEFQPKSAKEELDEELQSIADRGVDPAVTAQVRP
jgi:TRAP-type C4-dicarboxylate transport system permease small subunit